MTRTLILLDRDGVIDSMIVHPEHGTVDSPLHPDQVRIIEAVPEALRKLAAAGCSFAIVSNQPAAVQGKTTRENLVAVHEKILAELAAQGVQILSSHICWHRAEDQCACRKPEPGLLQEALALHPGFNAKTAWMVGDGITDVQAGGRLGLKTVFLGPEKCDHCKVFEDRDLKPTLWFRNLPAACDALIAAIHRS